ncbi:hypothetical protein [Lapillicoccus jejuensis]|uniref:Uncharacterized protein n=1 Tax=Lapillicoccus jejuensis TaxID=402171 RepID=A0A542E4P5_9MICO|nr:hypothetical protein [Lapillicoccus jejuensis]TQJ10295.1 hypothetical protein FB458_3415 [Lapillicoccus jejuensis]
MDSRTTSLVDVVAALVCVATGVVALVGHARWRARHAAQVPRPGRLSEVTRVLRRGDRLTPEQRPLAVAVVEQGALTALTMAGLLVLCAAQIAYAARQPDGGLLLVLFAAAASIALSALVTIGRQTLVARRQGVRPERLW